MLGKRKRETVRVSKKDLETAQSDSSESGSESEAIDAQEIFRRHFQSQFEALPEVAKKPKIALPAPEIEPEEDDEVSDFEGLSDTDEDGIQVVEHTDSQTRMVAMTKEELKRFMVIVLFCLNAQF